MSSSQPTRSALGLVTTAVPAARTPRWLLAAAAVVALAGVAAALALMLGRDSGGLTSVSPNSVGVIDPKTNELVAEVPVGIDPGPIAFGRERVWVANVEDETVSRIDPATRERGRTISVGGYPSDLTVGGGAVWVALGRAAELTRINPEQEEAARPGFRRSADDTACGAPRASVAFGAGRGLVRVRERRAGTHRPDTRKRGASGSRPGSHLARRASRRVHDVAFGLGSFWIVDRAANSIAEVDPATNRKVAKWTSGRRRVRSLSAPAPCGSPTSTTTP